MENKERVSLVEQAKKVVGFTPVQEFPPIAPAADGYVRRTPVQKIRIPEDYNQRLARRIAIAVLVGLFVGALVFTLLRFVFFI